MVATITACVLLMLFSMHAQVKVSSSERFVLDEVDVPYQEAGKGTWCATDINFPY